MALAARVSVWSWRQAAGVPCRPGGARGIVAGAGVLAVVVAASGCAGPARQAGGVGGAVPPRVAGEVTGLLFPGSVAQVMANRAFVQAITGLKQNEVRACMRGYGFGPAAQRYVATTIFGGPPALAPYVFPGNQGIGLVDLRVVARTGMLVPLYGSPGPGPVPGYSAKAQLRGFACVHRVIDYSPLSRALNGAAANGLRELWLKVAGRVAASGAVQAADRSFRACVIAHGAPQSAGSSLSVFVNWLANRLFRPKASAPMEPFRQLDAHWSGVFAGCAAPVVSATQRLLSAARPSFLQAHYPQITVVERQVAQAIAGA